MDSDSAEDCREYRVGTGIRGDLAEVERVLLEYEKRVDIFDMEIVNVYRVESLVVSAAYADLVVAAEWGQVEPDDFKLGVVEYERRIYLDRYSICF